VLMAQPHTISLNITASPVLIRVYQDEHNNDHIPTQ
jgi:hypothetical protein